MDAPQSLSADLSLQSLKDMSVCSFWFNVTVVTLRDDSAFLSLVFGLTGVL